MRISDWSSDVCSSDLGEGYLATDADDTGEPRDDAGRDARAVRRAVAGHGGARPGRRPTGVRGRAARQPPRLRDRVRAPRRDRKSVVLGTSVAVRVDRGGSRSIKKQKEERIQIK